MNFDLTRSSLMDSPGLGDSFLPFFKDTFSVLLVIKA